MTTGIIIKTTGDVEQFSTLPDKEYEFIRDAVGGIITAVSDRRLGLVGYVHDEGLLIGLEPNVMASALFGAPLVGECVVFGLYNAEGESDGESHDVPEEFLAEDFTALVRIVTDHPGVRTLVETEIAKVLADPTPKVVPMTDEDFDRWLSGS